MRLADRSKLRGGFCSWGFLLVVVAAVGFSTLASADEPPRVASQTSSEKGAAPNKAEHPLVQFIKEARSSQEAIARARNYQAAFSKKEVVGRNLFKDQMAIKFRREPFSVYLRFAGQNEGREVLYVAGRNQGKLLAHEGSGLKSFIGTLSIDPMSPRVMAEGRHPITEIGMEKMVGGLIAQWEAELANGYVEKDPKFYLTYPDAELNETNCKVLESTHTHAQKPFLFQTSRLYIDKKTNFPVRLEQWGFPPRPGDQAYIVEEYTYTDVKTDVNFSDRDFDTRNRNYRF